MSPSNYPIGFVAALLCTAASFRPAIASACDHQINVTVAQSGSPFRTLTLSGTWQVLGSTEIITLSLDALGRVEGTYQRHRGAGLAGRIWGQSDDGGQTMVGVWLGIPPGQTAGTMELGRLQMQVDLMNDQLSVYYWIDRHDFWEYTEFARRVRPSSP